MWVRRVVEQLLFDGPVLKHAFLKDTPRKAESTLALQRLGELPHPPHRLSLAMQDSLGFQDIWAVLCVHRCFLRVWVIHAEATRKTTAEISRLSVFKVR